MVGSKRRQRGLVRPRFRACYISICNRSLSWRIISTHTPLSSVLEAPNLLPPSPDLLTISLYSLRSQVATPITRTSCYNIPSLCLDQTSLSLAGNRCPGRCWWACRSLHFHSDDFLPDRKWVDLTRRRRERGLSVGRIARHPTSSSLLALPLSQTPHHHRRREIHPYGRHLQLAPASSHLPATTTSTTLTGQPPFGPPSSSFSSSFLPPRLLRVRGLCPPHQSAKQGVEDGCHRGGRRGGGGGRGTPLSLGRQQWWLKL